MSGNSGSGDKTDDGTGGKLNSSATNNMFVLDQNDVDAEENRMLIYEPVEGIPIGMEPLLEQKSFYFITGLPLAVSFDVTINRNFNIFNQAGQKIYHAGEVTNHCIDYCCNGHRYFTLYFFNGIGKVVMTATQRCTFCLCVSAAECAGANLTLHLGDGTLIGTIYQKYNCWKPRYVIRDQNKNLLMVVNGPGGGVCSQICGRKFKVSLPSIRGGTSKGVTVATIDKRSVTLPEDTCVQYKALLLGFLFLLELDYHQSSRTYSKALIIAGILFAALIVWRLGFV